MKNIPIYSQANKAAMWEDKNKKGERLPELEEDDKQNPKGRGKCCHPHALPWAVGKNMFSEIYYFKGWEKKL